MREVCAEFLGEVTEWPNVRDWKSRVGQKPTGGSNPPLSAFITGSTPKPVDLIYLKRSEEGLTGLNWA